MKPLNFDKKIWISMAVIVVILSVILVVVGYFFNIFLYLVGATIMMYVVKPFVKNIEARGFSENVSLAVVFFSFFVVVLLLFYMIIPLLLSELNSVSAQWTSSSVSLYDSIFDIRYNALGEKEYYLPSMDIKVDTNFIETWKSKIFDLIKSVISISLNLLFAAFIIVPILTLILVKEGSRLKREFFRLIPNQYFEISLSIFDGINKTVSNFIYAKAIQSGIIAAVATTGFLLIGLKGAIMLGIFAGILNVIPFIGPIISALPVMIVGYFFGGIGLALSGLGVVLFAQIIDNTILQPVILPKLMDHHPLTVVLLTLAGAKVLGPVGMIIAVPVFAIFKVVLTRIYNGLSVIYSRDEKEIHEMCKTDGQMHLF